MSKKQYRKLPGGATQLINPSTLYLGPDHLLKVTYVGGAEEYKRFYYADIQAVIVRRTPGYLGWGIGLGLPTALLLLWGLSILSQGSPVDRVTGWILVGIASVIGMGLLIHLLRGPTCQVVLKTAVHNELLPTLARIRTARKAIARLSVPVEQAQADIPVTEVGTDDAGPEVPPLEAMPEQQV